MDDCRKALVHTGICDAYNRDTRIPVLERSYDKLA